MRIIGPIPFVGEASFFLHQRLLAIHFLSMRWFNVSWFASNAKWSKRHWGELARIFKRIRTNHGEIDAHDTIKASVDFLKRLNAESLKFLEEAGDELIALQSLDVPNTMHRNLLSTNAIEITQKETRDMKYAPARRPIKRLVGLLNL